MSEVNLNQSFSTGEAQNNKNYLLPLTAMTTLFFLWGFITVLNDVLIPRLKAVFDLSYTEAMLIQFCFFGAYFIVSLPAGMLVRKVGYRKGVIIGLTVAALGCCLFYPAAAVHEYSLFLAALFILAGGITILQVSANPYVAALGPVETASSRLNLAQALNSLGTTIGPIVGAALFFGGTGALINEAAQADSVKVPYLMIEFLRQHIQATMAFYDPRSLDEHGGFYHFFKDDGTVYNTSTRHLVSSTRFVFNNAMAYCEFKQDDYQARVKHGLRYLNQHHRQSNGGYTWLIEDNQVMDGTNHCYGLAFVLLANAVAIKAGVNEAMNELTATWHLLEKHYWQSSHGLYLDEISDDFCQSSPYRGQNANMHLCEALITCYEATEDERYLERALLLAHNITVRQAHLANNLIWEHYDQHWQVDWMYNIDNPKHLFRPWGFQPGHLTEWAKLLIILNRHRPHPWLIERAEALFLTALDTAWDNEHGGICYGFAPDNTICDDDKYFWVQAESFAAAALLALETGKDVYWQWYEKIWQYSWDHMIDHTHGGWYRILTRDNRAYNDEKSPAGKTDYHTMGACYEVIRALKLKEAS